jgi:molybdopterin synthase sulfur carrier subunit
LGGLKIHLPKLLASYTGGSREVEAEGQTLAAVLEDLDRRFPGLRFRIVDEQDGPRPHIRFFVNREQVRRLDVALEAGDEVHIFQALSGGLS